MSDLTASKQRCVRSLQIIVLALVMGLAIFTGIALLIGEQQKSELPIVSYVAAAMATANVVLRLTVGPIIVATQRRQISGKGWRDLDDAGRFSRLFPIFQTKTIIENALLEGAGFLAVVAYLVESQTWTLPIAGIITAIIVMSIPTLDRIEDWIEDQGRFIESEMT